MNFATVEEALAAIRQGRMVVVVDDEDRENEGDLIMAAQFATPEAIRGNTCPGDTKSSGREAGSERSLMV